MVTRVGFVGVGRMGLPMCANLVAAGHTVTAGDARAELERAVMQRGVQWRATLAEVAAGADILITMLPGSREVREVMAGSGVLAAMPSTAVWVDMSSSDPAAVRELAAAARARGVGVLDAPVGGGVPAAQAGTLQVFVGGDAAVLARCRPVLEVLADPDRIIRVGGNGAGYTAKLLVNLLWFGPPWLPARLCWSLAAPESTSTFSVRCWRPVRHPLRSSGTTSARSSTGTTSRPSGWTGAVRSSQRSRTSPANSACHLS
jgi:3-hydroxyisobutyrate dehydrogenase